ncbi:hypothetical protein ES703_114775 [subsurface metagenome]
MASNKAYVVQIDESSNILEESVIDFEMDMSITYWIGCPDAYPALAMVTVGPSGINLEDGWRVAEVEIPLEPIVMDTDRQKLELDITKEFEFADGEATLLIDETN